MRPRSRAAAGKVSLVPFRATDVNQTTLSVSGADDEDPLAAGRVLRFSAWTEEIVVQGQIVRAAAS